jgi:serine/threonine-protein kinase
MTPPKDAKPLVFGRYELLMEVARGGMATLCLARLRGPEQFSKLIVLKRIHEHLAQDKGFIRMFLDEARIAALIQHPNVAAVFDMGDEDGVYFLTMEHVHGEDLVSVLKQTVRAPGVMTWHHAARIVCDAAAGLHAAHEAKNAEGQPLRVVHRDVSPQNILVTYDGHVKVIDFGIAYAAERLSQTDTGTVKGKAAYMAPEQVDSGPVDRRSDIFALGIVLYEAVCKQRLFREATEAATLHRVSRADIPLPRQVRPDLPEELERVLLRALKKNPADRYQTAGELGDDLELLLLASDRYVGHKQLASLMDELFHEDKKLKDKKLRYAQTVGYLNAAELTEPLAGSDATPPAGASITNPETSSQTDSTLWRRRSLGLWIGGLTAVVMIAMLLILVLRRAPYRGDRAPKNDEAALQNMAASSPRPGSDRARRSAAGVSRTVTLKVTVRPERAAATVAFRGHTYKGSVFQLIVPQSDQQELLEVTAPGFQKKSLIVTPIKNLETVVILTAKARKRPRRPGRAAPRPRKRAIDYVDSML